MIDWQVTDHVCAIKQHINERANERARSVQRESDQHLKPIPASSSLEVGQLE